MAASEMLKTWRLTKKNGCTPPQKLKSGTAAASADADVFAVGAAPAVAQIAPLRAAVVIADAAAVAARAAAATGAAAFLTFNVCDGVAAPLLLLLLSLLLQLQSLLLQLLV
ncbi:hypothetical protein Emag_002488 [Eimeria magna]